MGLGLRTIIANELIKPTSFQMRHSILIVDDSEDDRYLLKRYLRKSGLDVSIAEAPNGEQGMDLLLEEDQRLIVNPEIRTPLVVFLDVNMPVMNGWEFLEEFRNRQLQIKIKPTIVVMYSASDEDENKVRIGEYDFVKTYIVKGSLSPLQLKETIKSCV